MPCRAQTPKLARSVPLRPRRGCRRAPRNGASFPPTYRSARCTKDTAPRPTAPGPWNQSSDPAACPRHGGGTCSGRASACPRRGKARTDAPSTAHRPRRCSRMNNLPARRRPAVAPSAGPRRPPSPVSAQLRASAARHARPGTPAFRSGMSLPLSSPHVVGISFANDSSVTWRCINSIRRWQVQERDALNHGRRSSQPATITRPYGEARHAVILASLARNLGLDELCKKGERFLPAQIASLRRNRLRYPFLYDVHLSPDGQLLQRYCRLHFSREIRVVECVCVANTFMRHQFEVPSSEGVTAARRKVREGHLVCTTDFGIQLVNLAREAVRRKPLDHCICIEERPIDLLGRRAEHSVMPDGICGHECFSFRVGYGACKASGCALTDHAFRCCRLECLEPGVPTRIRGAAANPPVPPRASTLWLISCS